MAFLRQLAAGAFLSLAAARDITFPPVYGIAGQQILDQRGSIDVTGANFAGLNTFANVPYVHCLASEDEIEKFDIAILGAPFDTVSAISSSVLFELQLRYQYLCGYYLRGMHEWQNTGRHGAQL